MIQKQLDDIIETQKRQNAMIEIIHSSLVGTSYTDNKGLIHAVHQNTKFRRNAGYAAAFFVGVGTFIGGTIHWLKLKIFGM